MPDGAVDLSAYDMEEITALVEGMTPALVQQLVNHVCTDETMRNRWMALAEQVRPLFPSRNVMCGNADGMKAIITLGLSVQKQDALKTELKRKKVHAAESTAMTRKRAIKASAQTHLMKVWRNLLDLCFPPPPPLKKKGETEDEEDDGDEAAGTFLHRASPSCACLTSPTLHSAPQRQGLARQACRAARLGGCRYVSAPRLSLLCVPHPHLAEEPKAKAAEPKPKASKHARYEEDEGGNDGTFSRLGCLPNCNSPSPDHRLLALLKRHGGRLHALRRRAGAQARRLLRYVRLGLQPPNCISNLTTPTEPPEDKEEERNFKFQNKSSGAAAVFALEEWKTKLAVIRKEAVSCSEELTASFKLTEGQTEVRIEQSLFERNVMVLNDLGQSFDDKGVLVELSTKLTALSIK